MDKIACLKRRMHGSAADAADATAVMDRALCGACQREIPLSEAVVPEAVDYVVYFCGLDCYERWRIQAGVIEAR